MLARLLRAEAEGEGELGMLMVGNVGVNRVLGNCLDFRNIRSLPDMIFQVQEVLKLRKRDTFIKKRVTATYVLLNE